MKKVILLSILLCVTICSYAQQEKFNWSGTYIANDALAGGAVSTGLSPHYTYTLDVKKGVDKYECELLLSGFQLFVEIKAEAIQRGDYLIIRFVEYIDGFSLRYQDTTECILILEKKKHTIITKFASFHSSDDWEGRDPLFELKSY